MARKELETPERYGGEPLYGNLPDDYSQTQRPFTVTIIGPERHDSSGYATRYVVDAYSTEKAWAKALAWHIAIEETPDCMVVADESHEGVPQGRAGLHYSDLRPEHKRQHDIDDLAEQATELVERFDRATAAFIDGQGEIRPEYQAEYQQAVSSHQADGWGLVRTLSALDGR